MNIMIEAVPRSSGEMAANEQLVIAAHSLAETYAVLTRLLRRTGSGRLTPSP